MRGLRSRLEPVALARVLAARWTEAATYVAASAACWLFAMSAVERHRAFESNAYDFGFFDQIIWNTSQGRWFETSFTPYNFLGQHFQPVLLMFALMYRLGAGIEVLLVTQAIVVAAAALPLFYAVRRVTSSGLAGLAMSAGFLLSTSLHRGLDFDFHPELMGFFFVFLAAYYLVAGRPLATIVSLLPLLLLKEDMPLILAGFAVLLYVRGFRRPAVGLFGVAAAWVVAIVLIAMPLIRGGSGDLTDRYSYLVEGSTFWSLVPNVASRGFDQISGEPLDAIVDLLASTGFVGVLSPIALLVAVPSLLLGALSEHPQQSKLELHYSMAPLALTWVAAVLGIERLARVRLRDGVARTALPMSAGGIVLACSVLTFVLWSPYSPRTEHRAPDEAHRAVIRDALALIPPNASVSAQGTLLPHLSQRRDVYEFPRLEGADYVIIDPSLPTTGQTRDAGYEQEIATLSERGYERVFDEAGVGVFRRVR